MRDNAFNEWLATKYATVNGRPLPAHSRSSMRSNCARVEGKLGNLDEHFRRDGLSELLRLLEYPLGDYRAGKKPSHGIEIKGNAYRVTFQLRFSVRAYRQFCSGQHAYPGLDSAADGTSRHYLAPPANNRPVRRGWPEWRAPDDVDLLPLAHSVARFSHFLHPDVVRRIVEDNERHRAPWSERLDALGIDPQLYLWPDCATMFPGVRRHAGSAETAQFRGRVPLDPALAQAISLDDNHLPRQIWSFALRMRQLSGRGPDGYEVAHLLHHKASGSRLAEEFEIAASCKRAREGFGLPALFSSAANIAYVRKSLIRPTDTTGPLRTLLYRRAAQLHGAFCNLTPPGWRHIELAPVSWSVDAFDWAAPDGDVDGVDAFLAYRHRELDRRFAAVSAT